MGFKVVMVILSTIDEGVFEKKKKRWAKIQITLNFVAIEVSLPI
jgi:hypothetical protein